VVTVDRRSREALDRDWLVVHAELPLLLGLVAVGVGVATVVFLWIAALS
jgi:hypothetical protein